jgi:hypothetical protein
MTPERIAGGTCNPPFPVYADLVGDLVAAHHADTRQAKDPPAATSRQTCIRKALYRQGRQMPAV